MLIEIELVDRAAGSLDARAHTIAGRGRAQRDRAAVGRRARLGADRVAAAIP